jgi:hypothetical protein
MTPHLLPLDIVLAEKLIKAGCPDSEIIAVLAGRGIPPAGAAQLVNDLRAGKAVTCSLLPTPGRKPNQDASIARRKERSPVPPAPEGKQRAPAVWLIVMLFVCLGLVAGSMIFSSYRESAETDVLLDRLAKAALEVMRTVSNAPSRVVPANLSQPGAEAGVNEDQSFLDYRLLLNQLAARRLSSSQQVRLEVITSKLDSFTARGVEKGAEP